jgi:3-carboxy-cis,cis-muconate cycloisomerase
LLDEATLDHLSDPAQYAGQSERFAEVAASAWQMLRAERTNHANHSIHDKG